MRMLIVALLATLACVGCDKKEETPAAAGAKTEKAAEAPKEMPKPGTNTAAVAAPDPDDDLPTIADYEDEAEKDITKDSVDSEVDKLAKEIGE